MRRSVLTAVLAAAIVLMAASASLAQNQITLGANGGYTFSWAELELEYKTNDLGFGAQFGFGYGRVEIAGFGRYYFPLNELINLAPEYELNLMQASPLRCFWTLYQSLRRASASRWAPASTSGGII